MSDKSIRILVVEDHHVVRKGLITLLELVEGFKVVGEAGDGVEAITQFHLCRPDVTLIDLRLPGRSGVEVVESIRQDSKNARFVVLTNHDGDEDIYRALRAGVQSYLLKSSTSDELFSAIRLVHEGKSYISDGIAGKLATRLGGEQLTERETDILAHIVHGRSNKKIADLLGISETTVRSHLQNLSKKLGVSGRTQAAITAVQRGIVTPEFPRSDVKEG